MPFMPMFSPTREEFWGRNSGEENAMLTAPVTMLMRQTAPRTESEARI